ncbi:class II fructose-1,6-bisphosphate aldolase [Brevibacillus porteri]|uniref:Fructose-1,6-bisphosphate aldolase, class II n=1 Tax=Brevibacillus porteri TaxID=2126350 RepID=A0ABX5FN19_9BACL|nr:class II fructose-1,6-bisphosphate aldolase [Brevibacillus porteri]MED1799891.1 class II fructose-1,6-bisphosphate aldolase [Brevibacillus porteri]MED2132915.1 class II fructose-1,6-bisphosphate aldolase [Brevibacillus porteri]MED2744172.1 class II fructose-1,6-bisphosphate aldolase [Brevibacillus porteri]MED2816788.1 class II fructose-1,6-bisphosphate aldolase [Brevibacillus porteri]MED2894362.1 class II fructose-1,6-bisphosphate aldolase [Brevibacillus porteri]
MALVSSTQMLRTAREQGYCVGAFNVHTMEMLQAVVEAACEANAPLILQTTVGTVRHLGPEYIAAIARVASEEARVPIALHLDHCHEEELIVRCIEAGYTSVMIDASMHPFAENAEMTRRVVELARERGVNVEAELGKVGGVEDDLVVDDADAALADPIECERFIELTGVDTLAPAIGTAHGIYKGEPRIDFARIEEIARRVSVPLVLHGGSGIPEEQVKRAVQLGMAKMNVATELRIAFSQAIKGVFDDNPQENDPRTYMKQAKQAVKEVALAKMEMCGCIGKASGR